MEQLKANITFKVAGITFTNNLKGALSVREGEEVELVHCPKELQGYPNYIKVIRKSTGDQIGAVPECDNKSAGMTQETRDVIMQFAQELKPATVSKIHKAKTTETISGMLLEYLDGDYSIGKHLANAMKENKAGYAKDGGEDTITCGIEIELDVVDSKRYRTHPETGKVYRRTTAYLEEHKMFYTTEEEEKRLKYWEKKFEVNPFYKDPAKKQEREELVRDRLNKEYRIPSKKLYDTMVGMSKALQIPVRDFVEPVVEVPAVSEVLRITADYGTEVHDLANNAILHPFWSENGYNTTFGDSAFSDFMRDFQPYEIEIERKAEDGQETNIVYNDELDVAGQYDVKFRVGIDVELPSPDGGTIVIPRGTMIVLDYKSGKNDGKSSKGVYYTKTQIKHILQSSFYAQGVGAEYSVVLYLGGKVGDGICKGKRYDAWAVKTDAWYPKFVAIGQQKNIREENLDWSGDQIPFLYNQ